MSRRSSFVAAMAILVCAASPRPALAGRVSRAQFLSAVTDMVNGLGPRSAHAALAIRETYRPFVAPLALADFNDLEEGLNTGGLVPLPRDAQRFNVRVRLDGPSPIGEMDVEHQESYVAARPATIGCLLDIASRVKSGPIEVTSLVRHLDYQNELRATNANANTEVPTHALGLAFDIAIVNTPLPTVLELRDVLRKMSDAGDILVIAERQQLVFHVVPQPSRLGWYTDVYGRAMSGESWPHRAAVPASFTPEVSAEISSLQPTQEWAAEWWAAENVPLQMPLAVTVAPERPAVAVRAADPRGVPGYVSLLGEFLSTTWHWLSPLNAG